MARGMTANGGVSARVKLGYSAGLFGISMVQTSVSVLLIYFYTDVLVIPPATAGGIVFIGTLVDAIASIAAAWVANRHRSRFGRYRPVLMAVSAPLAVFFALMFMRPDLPSPMLWLYAGATHLCYRACYAFTLTPHSALIGRLTADANERAAIGAWKAIANNLGLIAAAYLGISTIEHLGGREATRGFAIFGIVFGLMAGATILCSAMMTRERADDTGADTARLMPALSLILRNSQMLIVLASTFLFFAGYMVMNGGVVYFFKYIAQAPAEAKLAVVAIGLGGLVMPPFWSMAIRRTSKAFIWAAGCMTVGLTFLAIYVLGLVAFVPVMLAYAVIGAGKSAVIVNFYAMTADAADYGHWKHGAKAEAYAFGMLSLANKSGTAVGGGLLGLLLDWSGLKVNAAQDLFTTDRLWIIICLAPAVLMALSGAVAMFFRVSAAQHHHIMRDLASRERNGL